MCALTVSNIAAGTGYRFRRCRPGPMPSYPSRLVRHLTLPDGTAITIRPIRPEDAEIEQQFVRDLSDESRYFRFLDSLRELSPKMLSHFTRVDYDRHMALIAVTLVDGKETEIGVARYVVAPDGTSCEFAIVVADAWQRRGIGTRLMHALVDAARQRGLTLMFGEALSSNHKMLRFVQELGFRIAFDTGDSHLMRIERTL